MLRSGLAAPLGGASPLTHERMCLHVWRSAGGAARGAQYARHDVIPQPHFIHV